MLRGPTNYNYYNYLSQIGAHLVENQVCTISHLRNPVEIEYIRNLTLNDA